ncbi:MAG TPA: RNA polymerase-associated protein RapA [Rhodanobacteraceae bacterium]|nr:RNA polymerase-associated protein RapA [Rhodanobacteraceae bacterium]
MNFIPGQRWISDAEPELGLGTVLRVEGRSVQVLFARANVLRSYAQVSAPLTRASFRVGQRIAGKGVSFVVERAELRDGLFVYAGEKRELGEGQLDDEQSVSLADDRLISARVDKPAAYELRKQALQARARARRSPAWGLMSARIDLLPHQLGIAAAVAERRAPRVLLADEVGLGKTIEAGMILARLLASGRANRALVLLPEALVVQWFVELQRRFNLAFAMLDEERCEAIELAGDQRNPFEDEQLVLAALPWLLQHPRRARQALEAGWDVLVVDEAHHLEWMPSQGASPGYDLVERFAANTPGVILLTATPEQLGRSGHFARLRLLDPARYADLDAYVAEADGYLALSRIAQRIADGQALDDADRAALHQRYPRDSALQALLARYPHSAPALLDALVDRHGTGRVMFRNRREGIGGFPQREPRIELRDSAQLDNDQRQRLLAEFIADTQAETADFAPDYENDPRIEWLAGLLDAHPRDKFLLICRSPAKVQALEAALRTRSGVATARFHEDMGLLQRDRAAAWFAQADGARLLLCSEIGSEGRNFQFAHHLVLWDLPLDPDLLEQRIGRLDRIGQRHAIALHAFAFGGTAQHALLRWHVEGVGVLRASPADGRELLLRYGETARHLAIAHARGGDAVDQELDVLIAETAAAHAQLTQRIHAGRDRLLELANGRQGGEDLLAALHDSDTLARGDTFITRLFEQFGIHDEELGDGSVLLDPEYLSTDALAGFADGPRRATFDRALALAREDLPLLRMDHPLVSGALDLLLAGEQGNAAFLADESLPPRSALLECVFVLECVADRVLDSERFLPATPLTTCVDSKLEPRDYTPSPQALTRAAERGVDASRFRKHLAHLVPPMLRKAEELARERAQSSIAMACAEVARVLNARHERLRALAAVNPAIRAEEVAALLTERDALLTALNQARPRLDAVRFAVSPDFLALR